MVRPNENLKPATLSYSGVGMAIVMVVLNLVRIQIKTWKRILAFVSLLKNDTDAGQSAVVSGGAKRSIAGFAGLAGD